MATLEALRRDSVEAFSRRLAEARAELAEREARVRELQAACLRDELCLTEERLQFAAAGSVAQLQRSERRLSGLALQLEQLRQRLARAVCAEQEARAQVDAQQGALLAAERARRAASGLLDGQRSEGLKRTARVEEEEAEESFRARRGPLET